MSSSETSRTLRDRCLVCEGRAIGFNFGALTCMACKAFFRRNAVKLGRIEFVCPLDGDCPITYENRRLCNCCRLAKCFRVGMKRDLILTDEEKRIRQEMIEENRQKRLIQFSKAFQNHFLSEQRNRIASILSIRDQNLLAKISNAYETHCLVKKFLDPQLFPSRSHSTIYELFHEYLPIHRSLMKFFTHLPYFQLLIKQKKFVFLQDQIGIVNHIHVSLLYRQLSTNFVVSLENLFGFTLTNRLLNCVERIQKFSYNPTLLKILMVILMFSSGFSLQMTRNIRIDCNSSTNLSMFFAQNIYVDLLWKYICHCSSSSLDAVRLWTDLIRCLLFVQSVHQSVEDYLGQIPYNIDFYSELIETE